MIRISVVRQKNMRQANRKADQWKLENSWRWIFFFFCKTAPLLVTQGCLSWTRLPGYSNLCTHAMWQCKYNTTIVNLTRFNYSRDFDKQPLFRDAPPDLILFSKRQSTKGRAYDLPKFLMFSCMNTMCTFKVWIRYRSSNLAKISVTVHVILPPH